MGEPTPPIPPSGDCPDCEDVMTSPTRGRLELPLVPITFEGDIPVLWSDGQWVFFNANFCIDPGFHCGLMAWGGYLGALVKNCTHPLVGCYPIRSCIDYNGGVKTAILSCY